MAAVKRYNKRQRKKKHLGEFQELGFLVDAKIDSALNEADVDIFMDRFLIDLIEPNGLAFGGGMNEEFSGFVVAMKAYGKVDETHRELVRSWLERQEILKDVVVGPLRDAWYGWG